MQKTNSRSAPCQAEKTGMTCPLHCIAEQRFEAKLHGVLAQLAYAGPKHQQRKCMRLPMHSQVQDFDTATNEML